VAQLRQAHHVITGTAETSGLDLSASRGMIDETQLWEVEGLYANEDKVLTRRPSFVQWGTQIIEPLPTDNNYYEEIAEVFILDEENWGDPVLTGSSVSGVLDNGALLLSGWESQDQIEPPEPQLGPGEVTVTRTMRGEEAFNTNGSHDGDMAFSFVIQVKNPAAGNYVRFRWAVKEDKLKEIMINTTGVVYKTGASSYASVPGTSGIVDGNVHRVDIFSDGSESYNIYIDGAFAATGPWTYVDNTSNYFVQISGLSDDSLTQDAYSITISSVVLRDGGLWPEVAWNYPCVSDMQTVRELKAASYVDTNSLLVATDTHIWVDYALGELWRPLKKVKRNKTRFGKFRGNTIICNYSDASRKTEVYEYSSGQISALTNAPDMRFTTEFTNRIWGAGDVNFPLRLYYSGDRQSNLWYNPDDPDIPITEDSDLEAGFIEFPGDDKARIRHIFGDFFGMLVVATDKEVWMISGTSPADYQRKRLTGAINAAGDLCGIDVFNDYWLLGKDGVSTIKTTDKFGDVEGHRLSILARGLFNTDTASGRMLDPANLYKSKMVYYPKFSTMFLHAEEGGKESPGVIYAMSAETKKWTGPWREEAESMRVVTLKYPTKDMVAIGKSDGRVMYMTQHVSNTDDIKLSSAVMTGRSIDPKLDTMKKTWGRLRIKNIPTGNWDITIRWKTDDEPWHTTTKTLCLPSHPLIGSTAVTGTSLAKSTSQPMVIEIPLDTKGRSLKYEITTNAPWVKLLRWEIDFSVAGYERD